VRIVLLGGAGLMGRVVATDLAEHGVSELVVADLNRAAAEELAASLGDGAYGVFCDARDTVALRDLLKGADAVLNCAQYYFNLHVMEAALAAHVPYADLGGLFHMTRRQLALNAQWAEAGLTAILGMGSSPGLPNVHARYLSERMVRMDYIRIYDGIGPPAGDRLEWGYSLDTILDEVTQQPVVFRDGDFVDLAPASEPEPFTFEPPLGRVTVHTSLHSEVATLPLSFAEKGVREVFFKINSFGFSPAAFAQLQMLAELGLASNEKMKVGDAEVTPRQLLKAMLARRPALPPAPLSDQREEIVTQVAGRETEDGPPVVYQVRSMCGPHGRWQLEAGAVITGVPLAVAGMWLAEGRLRGQSGVFAPEQIVPPEPFFAALAERGIQTTLVRAVSLSSKD
jgi:saccharopine dehydrogenase-like NADP-dependent oxidoreductase